MTDYLGDRNEHNIIKIARELELTRHQVDQTVRLLDEGNTVPFIARYRKEATGSLDEVLISDIRDRIEELREIDKRREAILKSLDDRELLTEELKEQIVAALTMTELEDIYLPYKPKRRTKATIAREKGLEPLAEKIFEQEEFDIRDEAEKYIDPEKQVESIEDALSGARDIIAEWINEDLDARTRMREFFADKATVRSVVTKDNEALGAKYRDYFDWEELLRDLPSHRLHAIMRGEREGYLSVHILPPEERALSILYELFVDGKSEASEQVRLAVKDAYKRLLAPSMENEIRSESKRQADTEAIRVFAENLRMLLLAPPLGQKRVLAIDPGFRTGCKVVVLDRQGNLQEHTTIYPHPPNGNPDEAGFVVDELVEDYEIEAVAIGNGTAGRETEKFIRSLGLPQKIQIVMVNESGASIYSASEVARREFPDHDLTVRGAVSIGRRLMDPLAELVKIDPKSIGVGQYQHDVDQSALKKALDDTVSICVNLVGVELNTASRELLTYVSGLGPHLADQIVRFRARQGTFKTRENLMDVAKFGPKAFEQSAGFLRIYNAENLLDSSAVHPESYHIVDRMAKDLKCTVADLMSSEDLRKRIDLKRYMTDTVGLPTLEDIMSELAKPGRDPREEFEEFSFDESVHEIEDLHDGMVLPGIVTNVTNFGVFVDVGVHQDGLVHVSQIADKFIKDPREIIKVNQKVKVKVLEVDLERNRIALTMKGVK